MNSHHRPPRLLRPYGIGPSPLPHLEGTIPLPDGRRLGYAEFGDPRGPLVLWFHGSPGARRQVPPVARQASLNLGLRIVCVERPGVGDSTDHLYAQLSDWAADVAIVADRLGHERFMVVGLSGGAPYALACAHQLNSRVVAAGLLGSLVPIAGEDATAEGLLTLTRRFNALMSAMRMPLGTGLRGFVQIATPFAHTMAQAFGQMMPVGDRRVLGDPNVEAMFVDDLIVGSQRQFRAFVNDIILFGRPWGFRLADVPVPVRWWHGDEDPFVPLEQARRASAMIPNVELMVRAGESHLGDFAAADEVLAVLARIWQEGEGQ